MPTSISEKMSQASSKERTSLRGSKERTSVSGSKERVPRSINAGRRESKSKVERVPGIDYIEDHPLKYVVADTGGASVILISKPIDADEDDLLKVRCRYGNTDINHDMEKRMYSQFIKDAQHVERTCEGGLLGKIEKGQELIKARLSISKGAKTEEEDAYDAFKKEGLTYLVQKLEEAEAKLNNAPEEERIKEMLSPGDWFMAQLLLTQ